MEGPWLIEVPIRDGKLDFSGHRTKRVELFHKDGAFEVLFGIGILDEGENIYVYGVRDKKGEPFYRRQLVVAKAPRQTYGDVSTWRFWTGERWSESIADCNRDEAALADAISNELSVTKMIGGKHDGKYILVYTEMCVSEKLNFAVADSPHSKFTGTTTFYHCPEPKDYDVEIKRKSGEKANVVTYNAKAHPRLSGPGELLVSYNLNVFGLREGMIFAEKKYGFPRFVRLRFDAVDHERADGKPSPLDIPIRKAVVANRPKEWGVPLELEGVPNLHRVTDNLYRSAQPTEAGMKNLKSRGFETIVSLRTFNSDRDEIGDLGLGYERIYMQAWNLEEEDIMRFLRLVDNPKRQPVLVHCQHGADRTGAVIAVYRMVVQGWSKEKAIKEMKEGGYGYHTVWNQSFDRFFRKLNIDHLKRKLAENR